MVPPGQQWPLKPATVIPLVMGKLDKLSMPAPPPHLFDVPLGCSAVRRLFALYWCRAVRAPLVHDGFLESVGDPEPYRVWRYHPRVIPHLSAYNLGDAADRADHWLLVDRLSRLLFAGKGADVLAVLEYQQRGIIAPLQNLSPDENSGVARVLGRALTGIRRGYGRVLLPDASLRVELRAWIERTVS